MSRTSNSSHWELLFCMNQWFLLRVFLKDLFEISCFTRDEREVQFHCSRLVLLSVLRSWPGILHFCHPANSSGLRSLVNILYLKQLEVRVSSQVDVFQLTKIILLWCWKEKCASSCLLLGPWKVEKYVIHMEISLCLLFYYFPVWWHLFSEYPYVYCPPSVLCLCVGTHSYVLSYESTGYIEFKNVLRFENLFYFHFMILRLVSVYNTLSRSY